jgi:hypothetical protein
MKAFFTLAFIVLINFFAQANTIGFSKGSEFEAINLSGRLTIYCPGANPTYRIVDCSEDRLFPNEFDFFIGPKIIGATSVQLSNAAVNRRTQKSKYNASTGQSKSEFNLWMRTLLQSPLLKIGENTVSYVLLNEQKEILDSGEFQAIVTRGEDRVCPDGNTISNWPEDCESTTYIRCSGYFSEYNYCKQ